MTTLSPRQREIIRLIADGNTDKEISDKCRITKRTVEMHVARLMGKLGARSRSQAVFMVFAR